MDAGDFIWVEFDPSYGHEQSGRRPALVVSINKYNVRSSFTLVCPITRSTRPWPFKVVLSPDEPVKGAVLVDQIKSIDRGRIVSPPIGRAGDATLTSVRETLNDILVLAAPNSF